LEVYAGTGVATRLEAGPAVVWGPSGENVNGDTLGQLREPLGWSSLVAEETARAALGRVGGDGEGGARGRRRGQRS